MEGIQPEPVGQHTGPVSGMLAHLQANPKQAAGVNFPALGWRVFITVEGPDLYRVRIANEAGTVLADDRMTEQAIETYMAATTVIEERRARILGALAVAEAMRILA